MKEIGKSAAKFVLYKNLSYICMIHIHIKIRKNEKNNKSRIKQRSV